MPRVSFGMALPVGVESRAEWINVFLREDFEPVELMKRLGPNMPRGLAPLKVDRLSMGRKQPQAVEEVFELRLFREVDRRLAEWQAFMAAPEHLIEKQTKKKGLKEVDIRPVVKSLEAEGDALTLVLDWRQQYMSPLVLCQTVMSGISPLDFGLTKTAQRFEEAD